MGRFYHDWRRVTPLSTVFRTADRLCFLDEEDYQVLHPDHIPEPVEQEHKRRGDSLLTGGFDSSFVKRTGRNPAGTLLLGYEIQLQQEMNHRRGW